MLDNEKRKKRPNIPVCAGVGSAAQPRLALRFFAAAATRLTSMAPQPPYTPARAASTLRWCTIVVLVRLYTTTVVWCN